MKKLIVILLFLIPITLQAYYYQYPDYVYDFYDFNGNTQSTKLGKYMATGTNPLNNAYVIDKNGNSNSAIKMNSSTLPLNPDVVNLLKNASEYSIQVWIKLAATTSFISPIGYGAGLPRGIELTTNNGDTWIFWYKTSNINNLSRYGIGTDWFHVNICFKNNTLKFIQNGTVTFQTGITNPIVDGGLNFGGAVTASGAGAPTIDTLIISTQAVETEILPIGYSEKKYFTPEEIIYFGADQMYYDGE